MNSDPVDVPTPIPSLTPTPTVTVTQTITETQTPVKTVAPTISEEVILDEGTAVYSGTYKIFKFEDYLPDGGFLYPGDSFKVEITSEQPVNVLFFRDNDLEIFKSASIRWDGPDNEWKYPSGLESLVKFDEVTRKKFDIVIDNLGKYSLCIDGRISENDLTVANDAAKLDIKVIKLEK